MTHSDFINEASEYISQRIPYKAFISIVLGSGLGNLIHEIAIDKRIPYSTIPHFPVSTVVGHEGELIVGRIGRKRVFVLNGRKHYYEGESIQKVVFPIQVMQQLGVKKLILSNAAGGLNPSFAVGDVMLIKDHINWLFDNPLTGMMNTNLHPTTIYSSDLIKLTQQIAKEKKISLQSGVYLATSGPYYGTQAESRSQFQLGADAVGMSTVPEALAAFRLGMNVLAFSVITDIAAIGVEEHPTHEKVVQAAQSAGEKMIVLVKEIINRQQ